MNEQVSPQDQPPPENPPGQPPDPEQISTWQMSSTVTADGKFEGYWQLKLIS